MTMDDVVRIEPVPPIGLMPQFIHDEHRLRAINSAIERYVNHLMPIPEEWLDERDELLRRKQ